MTTMKNVKTRKVKNVKTWKVETTSNGLVLTINGETYTMNAATGHSMAFDLQRSAVGHNPPPIERDVE